MKRQGKRQTENRTLDTPYWRRKRRLFARREGGGDTGPDARSKYTAEIPNSPSVL